MTAEPGTRTIAAFDFDGTLSKRDTLAPFLSKLVGPARLGRALAVDLPRLVGSAVGRSDRDAAKERLFVRLLAGMLFERVAAAGRSYGEQVVGSQLRPDMRGRLEWHREQGHELVIVSASLHVYLETVAERLGVGTLLCTELEVDAAGRCTGHMLGGNCRAAAKAERLRAHLGDGPITIWAYGDSAGDNEMLALADHAVRITRRTHLTLTP